MKKSVENLNEIVLESNDRFDVPKSKTRKAQRSSSSTFASFFGSTSPIRRGFSLFRPKRSRLDSNETFEQLIQRLRLDFKVKAEQLDARKSAAWIPSVERWQSKINRKLEKILLENDLLKKTIEDLDTFVDHQPGSSLFVVETRIPHFLCEWFSTMTSSRRRKTIARIVKTNRSSVALPHSDLFLKDEEIPGVALFK